MTSKGFMDRNTFSIDSITWNDLSLDEIYSRLNSCITSAGDDFLLHRLKNPYINESQEYNNEVTLIDEISRLGTGTTYDGMIDMLTKISKLKKYEFSNEIKSFELEENRSNAKHYLIDLFVLLSFCLIFIIPGPGIVLFFAAVAYAVSDYFKTKNIISGKLMVFNYLIRIINSVKKTRVVFAKEENSVMNMEFSRLMELVELFRPFVRGTFFIAEGARVTSNPLSILFDYIRMIFHVDIIKYNQMISFLKEHVDDASEIYAIVGRLDSAISINNYRTNINKLCKPKFISKNTINIENGYHPLIENPVCNSINTERNILITGSNASGKSTFLKTVALNAIFAQCFGFAFAESYEAPFFRIYTSMALRDDLNKGESYFVSEIKSLKRIIDATKIEDNKGIKTICFIDEVLRGTNTVERIAASVEILKSFYSNNVLCFAATHDIELTDLLTEEFDNYHFTENVENNDVRFSYNIIKGVATSRNAIRLLSVLGYDEDIVNKAGDRADKFVKTGVWS